MIRIYGHSDDCIEIEGDIREEVQPPGDDNGVSEFGFIACSNGTVVKISYGGEGEWRINEIVRGSTPCTIEPPIGDSYTDVATIEGAISWIVIGDKFERARS